MQKKETYEEYEQKMENRTLTAAEEKSPDTEVDEEDEDDFSRAPVDENGLMHLAPPV